MLHHCTAALDVLSTECIFAAVQTSLETRNGGPLLHIIDRYRPAYSSVEAIADG